MIATLEHELQYLSLVRAHAASNPQVDELKNRLAEAGFFNLPKFPKVLNLNNNPNMPSLNVILLDELVTPVVVHNDHVEMQAVQYIKGPQAFIGRIHPHGWSGVETIRLVEMIVPFMDSENGIMVPDHEREWHIRVKKDDLGEEICLPQRLYDFPEDQKWWDHVIQIRDLRTQDKFFKNAIELTLQGIARRAAKANFMKKLAPPQNINVFHAKGMGRFTV